MSSFQVLKAIRSHSFEGPNFLINVVIFFFFFHFLAILKFLQDLSTNVLKEEPQKLEDPQVKYFVCATIRILGAWLSEETQASYRLRFFL